MSALHGSPRAIGMFALYLNDCINSDNKLNLPLRDNNYWLNIALEVYKKSLKENKENFYDNKDIKGRIENLEKKEKVYDFSRTVGFDIKKTNNKTDFNFGLLSSQLPSSQSRQNILPNSSVRFLSSLPLPPPLPSLSLNRSLNASNSYLLSTPFTFKISSNDLTSHVTLWAELTATYKKPYTPNVSIEWSTLIAKLECLLFQIISVPFPSIAPPLTLKTEVHNDNLNGNRSNISRTSYNDESDKHCCDMNHLKDNFHRILSVDDKLFLQQKIMPELSSKCNHYDPTLTSDVQRKDNSKENKVDSKFMIFLPAYRIFLTWWLPLLFTLRKIKNEFCHILHSSVHIGSNCINSVPIVKGFIGRTGAIDLLKTGLSSFNIYFCYDDCPFQSALLRKW